MNKKLSVILIDWKVRESFHAVDLLSRQTVPRDEYELIWVEWYDHRPAALKDEIDRWIVLEKSGMYFKHAMYNEGLLASTGEIIVVCDSDAVFSPRFVESIIETFQRSREPIVLYLEEIRSDNKGFYPFRNFTWDEIMAAPGLMNWDEKRGLPRALTTTHDQIHTRNYGACFCARRSDVIAAGGFDEHPSYHNFMCGPYELGWRLVNAGFKEVWHEREWLLHTWHPWIRPDHDVVGHHDGRRINSLALEARRTGRTFPYLENPRIRGVQQMPEGPVVFPPEAADRPRRHRLRSLFQRPLLSRVLLLSEIDPWETLSRSLDGTDLALARETFYYDKAFHTFGRDAVHQQLEILCRGFKPELILLAKPSSEAAPDRNVLDQLASEIGARISAPPAVIIDEAFFPSPAGIRDIEIYSCGPISGDAQRRCAITGAARRLHEFSPFERAAVLTRVKICINDRDGEDAAARGLEALASGCLLIQHEGISLPSNFVREKHYLTFTTDADLLDAIKRRPNCAGDAAQIAARHNAAAWRQVFEKHGFNGVPGGHLQKLRRLARGKKRPSLPHHKRLAIFGAGTTGQETLEALRRASNTVVCFLDNADDRQNKLLAGLPIRPVAWAASADADIDGVVLAFQGNTNLARYQLQALGFRSDIIDYLPRKPSM